MATNAAPIAATWITIAQAADLMSVSTKTVRRLISVSYTHLTLPTNREV